MDNYILLIPIGILFVLIILIIMFLRKSKNNNEKDTSILDVNEVGVSSDSEFSYGYEKEETIVMNPINENKEEKQEEFPDVSLEEKDITKESSEE